MGMNWDMLDQASEQLEADKEIIYSGGKSGYLLVDDWGFNKDKEADIRLLPPSPEMTYYFKRVIRYKIGKARFYGKDVFGEENVAEEMHQHYANLAASDREIKALLGDYKQYKREVLYLVPALIFDDPENLMPRDENGKVICFTHKNFNLLHSIMSDARYRRDDPEWGILSRSAGRNLTLRNGSKQITPDSHASDLSNEYYDEYYTGDKYPDIMHFLKTQAKTDEHIRSVFGAHFDGTAVIDDDGSEKERLLGASEAPTVSAPKKATAPVTRKAPAAKKATAPKKAKAPTVSAPKKATAPVTPGSNDDEDTDSALLEMMGGID